MTALFRPEALAAQQQAWLGHVRLVRPLPLVALSLAACGAAVCVLAFLVQAQYTRKAHVSGVLLPDLGLIRLLPPEAAVVAERRAREGQVVKRGDVLFVLSVDRATLSGPSQQQVLRSLDIKQQSLREAMVREGALLQSQRSALEQQIAARKSELPQLGAEAQLQQQRLVLSRDALAQFTSLQAENFISAAQVKAKTEEMLAVQAQLQALDRQRAGVQRDIAGLEAQLRELPLRAQAASGELERDLAGVAQAAAETQARQQVVVLAPSDGVLSTVVADVGQTVLPQAALASLVPASARLQAQLYAPSNALGFVQPGLPVLLRYAAYPYQKFGHQTGKVVEIGRTPLSSGDLAGVPLAGVGGTQAGGEPLYRITVALDRQSMPAGGLPQPLMAGMQLEADVQLERRRLIEWMFEPLLGLRGRVATAGV